MSDRVVYQEIGKLPRGAFSQPSIYRHKFQDITIVKKWVPIIECSPEEITLLKEDSERLMSLSHPSIVQYCLFNFTDHWMSSLQRYAEGGTMADLIKECRGVHLPEGTVIDYVNQMLSGLQYLHDQSMRHGDLKPSNILFEDSDRSRLLLSDLGLEKEIIAGNWAREDAKYMPWPLSHHYLSADVLCGRALSPKSDMFALGCVWYELLELRKTFDEPEWDLTMYKVMKCEYKPLRKDVSSLSRHSITRLLADIPEHRPTAAEVQSFLSCHVKMGLVCAAVWLSKWMPLLTAIFTSISYQLASQITEWISTQQRIRARPMKVAVRRHPQRTPAQNVNQNSLRPSCIAFVNRIAQQQQMINAQRNDQNSSAQQDPRLRLIVVLQRIAQNYNLAGDLASLLAVLQIISAVQQHFLTQPAPVANEPESMEVDQAEESESSGAETNVRASCSDDAFEAQLRERSHSF
ncbi:hypothetical protein PMAYCL1PPCAC_26199 [Pristionchus mayeri]|uniref:non-specific serine/threonine protein kinase n=1 Tax=Pristionchus mayeri TaxID=1317129 RepID=A0AAN5D5H7_9BILA|nr:hypothetical protein PMAYCL1PPCAC_26199 [Pristionchus mayeri]